MAKFALSNPIIKRACSAAGADIVFDFGPAAKAELKIIGSATSINLLISDEGDIKPLDLQADEALREGDAYYQALKSVLNGQVSSVMMEQAIKKGWKEVYHTTVLELLVELNPDQVLALIGSTPLVTTGEAHDSKALGQ